MAKGGNTHKYAASRKRWDIIAVIYPTRTMPLFHCQTRYNRGGKWWKYNWWKAVLLHKISTVCHTIRHNARLMISPLFICIWNSLHKWMCDQRNGPNAAITLTEDNRFCVFSYKHRLATWKGIVRIKIRSLNRIKLEILQDILIILAKSKYTRTSPLCHLKKYQKFHTSRHFDRNNGIFIFSWRHIFKTFFCDIFFYKAVFYTGSCFT